ncbi:MAG: DegT/DnrJ/EryC1/StrS family aminotransferase [Deltaproteobacteria bacterium]|nr:DegT/DnrJ/EryC1/StrS family aminotransferase [Deltaproteobacteria bacterium]
MKVPLLDLRKQFESLRDEIMAVTEEVYDSQQFILGPKVEELEKNVAAYCRCRHAVGVSSGTDALLVSLMTAGVGADDLVVTTPYTFFATAGSITRLGARPVYADIDPRTYNLDPEDLGRRVQSLTKRERDRLKAIIPVHLFGQCADMEPILDFAERYHIDIIEDAAQAIGSEYAFADGSIKRAGSMGDTGCFSFFPSKNLGAFGDGGMVTTNSDELFERLRILRVHGSKPKYYHRLIGGNFRLDALQAAVLNVKLRYLDAWTAKRIQNAERYRGLFSGAGLEEIVLPLEKERRHIYNQFVIRVPKGRDELKAFLQDQGIGAEIYYPVPLHIQDCFTYLGYRPGDFPVSMEAASTTLALPIYPELTANQQAYVVEKIVEFLKGRPLEKKVQ